MPSLIFDEKCLQGIFCAIPVPQQKKIPTKQKKKKVIVLSGPTAVGKTQISLKIAMILNGEIVSADSMQVYRGMDIGTAKVSKSEREKIPHHLIDICDLKDNFNVVEFYEAAMEAIDGILARGKIPIVVGGTGFYINALLYGPPAGPPSVATTRLQLEQEMLQMGAGAMYDKLKTLDPHYAATITQHDRQKIIRALEIIALTNQKVTHFSRTSVPMHHEEFDFRCWFLYYPKEILYPRIEERCDAMLKEGLIDEVQKLKEKGLLENRSASQAIGYRQTLDFLASIQEGDAYENFLRAFKQASRRYAKRQFTWFRKEPMFRWLDLQNMSTDDVVDVIIQDYELSF